MIYQKQNLFRKKSLERLSSPEKLDQLMQVVSPKNWLPLVSLGSLVGITLLWSVFGRIFITVEGRAMLVYPGKVLPLQSNSSGELLALNVEVGDFVKKGEVLATINRAEIQKQLQQQRAKLTELQSEDRALSFLRIQQHDLEKKAIQQQRQTLQQSLHHTRTITPILSEKGLEAIEQQRQKLLKQLQALWELSSTFEQRLKSRQRLLEGGAITTEVLLQAQKEYLSSLASIRDAESQLKQLDVKKAESQQQYLDSSNKVTQLQVQLQELDTKEASLNRQYLENSSTRNKEIQELKREIAKLEQQLNSSSRIISQHGGRIVEIAVTPGQIVRTGDILGRIEEAESPSSKLVGITYFQIGDGKKIQPGMTVQITPQTVKRERFGGILGKVTAVSGFPITKEAAVKSIGNSEVVEALLSDKQEGVIQILAELEQDSSTFSGYKWSSSKGPQLKISPGTTASVQIQVEELAPIEFVLPILRSYSGIY